MGRGLRWVGAVVLLVIAALLVVGSVTARFVRGELMNTDRYVETVAPLAADPEIQGAVATRLTQEVVDRIDIPALAGQLAEALDIEPRPAVTGLLAGPVTGWVESFVAGRIDKFVHSERFSQLWTTANRVAHEQVRAVLTGKSDGAVSTKGDSIVVDLGPLLAAVKQDLVSRGFTIAERVPDVSIPFTVASDDRLPEIQRYVRWLNTAATWLPVLAVILLGLGVLAAPNRRRGLLTGCVFAVVAILLALGALAVVRSRAADRAAARGGSVQATVDAFDVLSRFLLTALWTVLTVALLGIVWLYLAGPGRGAVAVRRLAGRGLGVAAAPLRSTGWLVRAAELLVRWRGWVAAVLAILALWALLSRPSVGTALWLAVGALVVIGVSGIATRLTTDAG